jgi:hypothetical protein
MDNRCMNDRQTIPYARCEREMKAVRSIAKLGAMPELRIFSCKSCGEVETKEIDQTP